MHDDCSYRISAKALVLNDKGQFLLTKEANGHWELPGGGIGYDESPQDALYREIKEEMGVEVTTVADTPSYFTTCKFDNSDRWLANIIYETRLASLDITPSDECVEIGFFSPEEIAHIPVFSNVKLFAEQFRARH